MGSEKWHKVLCENSPYSELFWPVFSRILTECGEIPRISPYSIQMREITDQNNSKYGHFSQHFSRTVVP